MSSFSYKLFLEFCQLILKISFHQIYCTMYSHLDNAGNKLSAYWLETRGWFGEGGGEPVRPGKGGGDGEDWIYG